MHWAVPTGSGFLEYPSKNAPLVVRGGDAIWEELFLSGIIWFLHNGLKWHRWHLLIHHGLSLVHNTNAMARHIMELSTENSISKSCNSCCPHISTYLFNGVDWIGECDQVCI